MAEGDQQERTEQPTSKRREDFRKKGQVAQSKEMHTAALLSGMLLLWFFYAPVFWDEFKELLGNLWFLGGTFDLTPLSVVNLAITVTGQVALLLAPALLLVLVIGFFSTYLQIGWLFTTKPLEPDLAKFNPVSGMAKLFSKRSLVELVKSLAKVLLVGTIAYLTVRGEFERSLLLIDMTPVDAVRFIGRVAALVLLKSSGILLVLGILDLVYQRWEMEQKMKMTKQEVKEEFKDAEGDPYIKARIRSIQMEMSRKRMMAAIPKADVVITNPTHLSVAVSYVREEMDAPQIVAKGADHLAMRIREIARENRVPLVENKPVAQALYQLEVGAQVPEELFQAVAEILAYVYNLKGNPPGRR